jgi:hypothetical protein
MPFDGDKVLEAQEMHFSDHVLAGEPGDIG